MALFKKRRKTSSFSSGELQQTLHKNLEFTAREQYKLLRTNLGFTLPEGQKCPIIGVTSSMRGEGKSTTSVNLSYVLAESGKKVLLIDGDLRIPSIAKKMEISAAPGLTDLLMGYDPKQFDEFRTTILDKWYILPAGELPPNPSELLGSHRMEKLLNALKEVFDYIIIDLPPVNIVSDAAAISNFVTGMLVVVREGYTEKKDLERCFRQLRLSGASILGCVMNEAKSGKGSYGRYKKYRYYKYYRYSSYYYYKSPESSKSKTK